MKREDIVKVLKSHFLFSCSDEYFGTIADDILQLASYDTKEKQPEVKLSHERQPSKQEREYIDNGYKENLIYRFNQFKQKGKWEFVTPSFDLKFLVAHKLVKENEIGQYADVGLRRLIEKKKHDRIANAGSMVRRMAYREQIARLEANELNDKDKMELRSSMAECCLKSFFTSINVLPL